MEMSFRIVGDRIRNQADVSALASDDWSVSAWVWATALVSAKESV
jgi:hypothetical protein